MLLMVISPEAPALKPGNGAAAVAVTLSTVFAPTKVVPSIVTEFVFDRVTLPMLGWLQVLSVDAK